MHFSRSISVLPRQFAMLLGVASLLFAPVANAATEKAPAFKSIFNGKDLTGWIAPSPNPFWRVENGVLIGINDEKQTGSMLKTEKNYKNFIVELDVRVQDPMDSGLFMRTPALQMQIGKSISLKKELTGSFYIGKAGYVEAGQAKDAVKLLKAGDWNTVRLEAKGDTFTVWLNGTQASRYTNPGYPDAGPISVQVHAKIGGKVEFRNMRVAELP
jgi:hypothetical protein